MAPGSRTGEAGMNTKMIAAILLLALGQVSEAQAQATGTDGRWLAWIGCWEGAGISESESQSTLLVCFRPVENGAAVESLTYSEGTLLGSELLRADGSPTTLSEGGCEGTRRMEWSADGRRIYLSSELSCGEGVRRSTRGLFTHLPGRMGWSHILGVEVGDAPALLEIRTFIPASPALLIASGIADPMQGIELAVNTSRVNAGSPLTASAVSELVARGGAPVARGALVERGDVLDPDAAMLRTLAREGVPGDVLDILIALSHSDRFQIAGGAPAPLADEGPADRGGFAFVPYTAPWGASSRVYTRWGDAYYVGRNYLIADSYGSAFYGADFYGRSPAYVYPYSMYPSMGFPYGSVRYPRYYVTQPPVVVAPTNPGPAIPPGRVDRDGGFSGGTSGTGGSGTAIPRSTPTTNSAPATSVAPAPSSEGGGGAPPRVAVPRQ